MPSRHNLVQVTKFQIAMRVAWIFVATIFAKDANTKAGTLDRVVRRSQTQKSEDAEDSADLPELSKSWKKDSPGAHDLPTSGIAESSASSSGEIAGWMPFKTIGRR